VFILEFEEFLDIFGPVYHYKKPIP
jgi:hypothetical protein